MERVGMRRSVFSFLLALLLAVSTAAQQQTAVVLRNVYLRLDSSTEQAPIRKLLPGERLTILDPAPDDGYYHAATDDQEEGWVWGQNIRIEGPPVAAPAAGVVRAGAFDPNWAKTPPNLSQFTNADGVRCGPFGDSDEHDTNQRKNRTNIPSVVHDVTFRAVADLPFPPKAPKERTQWSEEQLDVIRPFEDVGVRVVGFLVAIKPQTGGSGESTNCHMTRAPETDWHMALVENAGDGESESVVVETTPRIRRTHTKWTKTRLTPWLDSSLPVRITGWTFLDPEHSQPPGAVSLDVVGSSPDHEDRGEAR
jgi:hypothetical protein